MLNSQRRQAARAGRLICAGATVTILTLTVAGCGSHDDAEVRVATISRATVVEVVEAPAVVTARATATVSAPADGTISGLRAHEGQPVRAGQVLLRVESPDARRRLRLAQQADARATAVTAPTNAASGIARIEPASSAPQRAFAAARQAARRIPIGPARTYAVSALRAWQAQYVATRTAIDVAAGQLVAGVGSLSDAVARLSSAQRVQTRAAVDVARRTVDALTIRAPVAGTVSLAQPAGGRSHPSEASALVDKLPQSLQGQVGGLLGGGSSSVDATLSPDRPVSSGQPILTVTNTSSLRLTARVDETDVLLVKPGIPASATLDAVPDATYAAGVIAIDPSPTRSSRGGVGYVVRMSLGSGTMPDGSTAPTPRPGMSAIVQLKVRTARNVVAVPAAATFHHGRRDSVWVVKNGVAHEQVVLLGAQGSDKVQVVEGLQPGERVVVRGGDSVRDGQRVT